MTPAAEIQPRASGTRTALRCEGGIAPENGESPIPFAQRVNTLIANDDFETFARAVERCAYSRAEAKREAVVAGRRAYQTFERSMTLAEKLKYTLRRLVKGLGDFTAIP